MWKRVKHIAIAMFAMAAMAAPASAVTIIDFATGSDTGAGGNVYFDGANIIGEGIPIGRLLVVDAPMGNGDYDVFGPAFGSTGTPRGSLDFNTGTGDIAITGCVPGLVGSYPNDCQETLLSGTVTSFFAAGNNFVAVFGFDLKNPELLAAVGLDPNTPFQFTGSVQTGAGFGQGPENGQASVSTDIVNTAVPEPATMMLLGTGLLAAFRARRRMA